MTFQDLLRSFDSERITLDLTSGKQISGHVVFLGDDFVGIRVHSEHDVAEVVQFRCIASVHHIPVGKLHKA